MEYERFMGERLRSRITALSETVGFPRNTERAFPCIIALISPEVTTLG